MGVRRFEDLVAWQLARDLQRQIFAFTAIQPAARDVKFCSQIRDSSRSAKRNTAEGFGRFYPKEFIRYLRTPTGSLQETINHLHDALEQQYITNAQHEQMMRLAKRALKANIRLQAYLRRSNDL